MDILGNCFLDLELDFRPRDDLVDWLQRGPKPVYVGFGSMVSRRRMFCVDFFWRFWWAIHFFCLWVKPIEDARQKADMIIKALKQTGQRGIISRGWGNLVPTSKYLPSLWSFSILDEIVENLYRFFFVVKEINDEVFPIEECPHEWLFPRCAAVVSQPLFFVDRGKPKSKLQSSYSPMKTRFRRTIFTIHLVFVLKSLKTIPFFKKHVEPEIE